MQHGMCKKSRKSSIFESGVFYSQFMLNKSLKFESFGCLKKLSIFFYKKKDK